MEKRSVVCAFLLGVLVLAPLFGFCWVEEAHMISGAILQKMLSEEEATHLESFLFLMIDDYPETSSIVSATKWALDIEAAPKPHGTVSWRRYDNFSLFNQLRYLRRPFNPQKITLHPQDRKLPYGDTGSEMASRSIINALRTFVQRFPQTTADRMSEKWTKKRPLRETPMEEVVNDFVAYSKDFASLTGPRDSGPYLDKQAELLSQENMSGTRVSLNLHLRLLLNIFVNIHQPLCTIETFWRDFPRGDSSGKKIILKHPEGLSELTLFDLWETVGGLCAQQGSEVRESIVFSKADALMRDFPEGSFSEAELSIDFDKDFMKNIADESYALAKNVAYSPKAFKSATFGKASMPLAVSKRYLQRVFVTSARQLVLGSYRLARLLKKLLPLLPKPAEKCMTKEARSLWEGNGSAPVITP